MVGCTEKLCCGSSPAFLALSIMCDRDEAFKKEELQSVERRDHPEQEMTGVTPKPQAELPSRRSPFPTL